MSSTLLTYLPSLRLPPSAPLFPQGSKNNYNLMEDSDFNFNGNDAVGLFNDGGNLVDIYGEFQVDGTGDPWEYIDSWSYRNDGTSASTTWTAADWTVAGANSLDNDNNQQTTLTNGFGQYTPSCAGT